MAKVKCDNCEKDALYTCADPGANPVNFCSSCLPTWLLDRALAGQLPLVKPEAPKSSKASKKKTADESN